MGAALETPVIPAKAGIHSADLGKCAVTDWIPAFAGMTGRALRVMNRAGDRQRTALALRLRKRPPKFNRDRAYCAGLFFLGAGSQRLIW